jgi:phosphoribosylformylglycinamidine (FGAM) synthase-like amidotransferase family enzyme
MRAGVVVFPGSNCDRDAAKALDRATGRKTAMLWHAETDIPADLDLIVLPGGFPMATIYAPVRWRLIRPSCARSSPGHKKAYG